MRTPPKTGALGALLLAGALSGTGCTTAGGPAEPRGATDLAELKQRIVELQRQTRMSEVEIARLRERVAELEARLGDGGTDRAGSSRPATGAGAAGELRREDREPDAPTRPSPPSRAAGEAPLLEEIDLEEETAPDAVPRREAAPSPSPPPSSAEPSDRPVGRPVTPEAQQIYDEGYTLYHRGRYLDAEATFQRFLRLYGNSDLGDNAQYWIGESRYARGDLRGALSAFRETIERYPRGNKVPDALVKAGQTLEALGDVEGARETYGEVLRRFPDSPTAAVAREHLDRLP